MHVGVLTLDLYIAGSKSLKEKRSVIRSAKDRISNKFNVSISEVDYMDLTQRSKLGIAMVSNDAGIIKSTFQQIEKLVEQDYRVQIVECFSEFR